MSWVTDTLGASIGKKLMMALSGLCFCMFLVVHLIGNLMIYGGKETFNAYVEHLHALDPVITVAEWGLLILALIHITTGSVLFFQNLGARRVRYIVNKSAGGRTIGSRTMPYTGMILLVFIVFHLIDFHFADRTGTTLYDIVTQTFSSPLYMLFYIAVMIVAAVHVSHGLWSAFQTIGANHSKYMPFIKGLGLVFSVVVGVGFGFIPIFISMVV